MSEPVAYVDKIWIERPDFVMSNQLDIGRLFMREGKEIKNYIPLYTHPMRELSEEEITLIAIEFSVGSTVLPHSFARAILKKASE